MTGQIKIIAGQFKGKKIKVPEMIDCRPTPNRVRESLFNTLQFDIRDAHCLDAFAGSGALGLEASSRGAQTVVFLEKEPRVFLNLKKTLIDFKASASTLELHQLDCINYLNQTNRQFDIIFLDPPFQQNLWQSVCEIIFQKNILTPEGILYIEAPQLIQLSSSDWQIYKHQKMSSVYMHFFKLNPKEQP
jgi:16S rRNA (guanine966-N2)-methyltransferase